MAFLIGTDEAGYGPNLGPLVISSSTWHAPDDLVDCDLYEILCDAVSRTSNDKSKVPIADSKQLYQPGKGLAALECGLFSLFATLGVSASQWRDVWRALAESSLEKLNQICWYQQYESPVPYDVNLADVTDSIAALRANALSTGIACRSIQSVAIFPEEFNDSVDRLGSKGELLSLSTLALVRTCLLACDEYPIRVQCDKHGGRNKYAGLLQHVFPEHFVEVVHESRAISTYRWGTRTQRVEISFAARGESFLPSALASMASKYLRELAMKAFNDFWKTHVPGLRPTAGYPVDARRFRDEIEPVRKQLEIHPRMLWRNR